MNFPPGKQRRLKQAKEEAQEEIERYQKEREKQFKEFEAKVSFFFFKVRSRDHLLSLHHQIFF